MIENVPESLKDKPKDVDLSKLEQCILDTKEAAKFDLTGNTMLRERIPLLIKMLRLVKTEVARTSIECRPDRFDVDRAEWYEPFEDIQKALDYAEYQIRTKLREHELGREIFSDFTRNCSNEYLTDSKPDGFGGYISRRKFTPWLTPDQARKAVEIAREEMLDKICEWIGKQKDLLEDSFSDPNDFADILKQAMKDE